jgi:SAM-dependent methyltransferase
MVGFFKINSNGGIMEHQGIKNKVKEGYGRVAMENRPCCGTPSSCCGSGASIQSIGEMIGYSKEEMSQVPEGANLGLGCGNPVALASLREGQTVLDLGSGAGFDCFLTARAVGETGRVIGVDMTPEMIQKARENAEKGGYRNVEFRLGDIESLPVIDNSVDVILSNCVINLSPNKPRVFSEAFRVLKTGGKLTLSDVVLLQPLPPELANSSAAYLGCVAGASLKSDYLEMLSAAGFTDVQVVGESPFYLGEAAADPIVQAIIEEAKLTSEQVKEVGKSIVSIKVVATKVT